MGRVKLNHKLFDWRKQRELVLREVSKYIAIDSSDLYLNNQSYLSYDYS